MIRFLYHLAWGPTMLALKEGEVEFAHSSLESSTVIDVDKLIEEFNLLLLGERQ